MSGILQKLKRKPLLEELQERFPRENIEPYGFCLIVPLKAFNKTHEEKLKSQGLRIYYQGYKGQTSAFIVLEKQAQKETVIEESSIEKPEADSKPSPVKKLKPWTPEERLTLKELLSKKVPINEIADKLGRSVYSVGAEKAHLEVNSEILHLPKRVKKLKPWTSQDTTTLKELLSQDVPVKEIAEKLGRTECAVDSKRHELKLLRRSNSSVESHSAQASEIKPKIEDPNPDAIKELLEAALLLYESDKQRACKLVLAEANRLLESS
jgi:hypothetical protein